MRHLIAESIDEQGGQILLYLEPPEVAPEVATGLDRLTLELNYAPIQVQGWKLSQALVSGDIEVTLQEICMAPDEIYALYQVLRDIDRSAWADD